VTPAAPGGGPGRRDQAAPPGGGLDRRDQAAQRLRVGLVGLAAVLLLIGLAGLVFSLRDGRPADGASPAIANAVDAEPLAELGVAPGTPQPPPAR